jgi:hypothetical protein
MMMSVPATCSIATANFMAASADLRGVRKMTVEQGPPAPLDHSGFALCKGRDSLSLGYDKDRADNTKGTDQELSQHRPRRSCHRSVVVDID